jgi:hypothetical protein
MNEIRREPRIEVNWPIKVFLDDKTIGGIAKNINQNGLFMSCEEPLFLKENYRISIFTPDHRAITIVGKAVWSTFYAMDDKNESVCIGLSFIEISNKDRHTLKEITQITTEE